MSSKRYKLKNNRVKRMLLMVDDTIQSTDEDCVENCNNLPEITAGTSTSSAEQPKLKGLLCVPIDSQDSNEIETSSNQALSRYYGLRDLPKQKYIDTDQDSLHEDFSPDCSEYVPSPERPESKSPFSNISSLSADSQCINRMITNSNFTSTPSTISNISVYLTNVNFVASPSIIYEATSVLSPLKKSNTVTINQSNIESKTLEDSQEDTTIDETLKPEETLQKDNITLTENINCSQDQEVNSNNEDKIEVQENSANNTEETDHNSNESNQQNQQELVTSEEEKKLTRKRKQNTSEWRRNKNKVLKNSGQAYEGCNTKKKFPGKTIGSLCVCKKGCGQKFSESERQAIFDKFYGLADREHQWLYISRHVETKSIKRMTLDRKNNRTQTLTYFLISNNERIPVCKTFFLNTLQIGEQVVYTAVEKVTRADEGLKDKRGMHDNRPYKMNTATEATIKAHIDLFPKVESHYTRKDSKREYLSENLNITKMYRFYTEWFIQQGYTDIVMGTKRQYETVFNCQYNYSFFKPKKDQCTSCSIYEQSDLNGKATLEEKHRLHLQKKEKIRLLKKEEIETADKDNTTVAIFDLQKVLSIPQSEVGTFHYKRKYPCYNFTVYDALRKIGYCYVWHFQIAKRGSTEIGSALLLFFKSEQEKGIRTFSLYSDGCYGQNKNRYIFALYIYAAKLLGISITHRFFETGHSQNEGDSMHACIEKNLKHKVLYTPDQIYSIILNSKVTGEKYRVKELDQSEIYDLKPLVDDKLWRCDKNHNVRHWADVMEVSVTDSNPNKLFFKYNFEDDCSELDINNPRSALGRRRGRKSTQDSSSVSTDNIELKRAYHQPIPISKALHADLLSLCNSEAIPRFYHPFYESLSCTEAPIESTSEVEE
ncbi:uncharacterized protein LOC123697033 [Colias croceus]|uniref:uncharacterized protein LOC123697033 n=1 Tax=Colias crocea TaxID=72248 RepID=UPI001E27DDF6|nr:uncharacterized protein LOC123697033 [Colias croceus]